MTHEEKRVILRNLAKELIIDTQKEQCLSGSNFQQGRDNDFGIASHGDWSANGLLNRLFDKNAKRTTRN